MINWKKSMPILVSGGCCLLLGLLWLTVVRSGLVPRLFVPAPGDVWQALVETGFGEGYKGYSLWNHLTVSLLRIFKAFLLASSVGIPLGLLCGRSSVLKAVFSPFVYFYRPLPPLAYYTLLVIWMGIGDLSKVTLLMLAGFAPIFLSCLSAVENLDPARLTVAYTLGATPIKAFWHVILPSCLPEILTGLRTALGFIYTTLVAAEMVAAKSGIGWMVLDASKFLKSDVIFMAILVMGLTGIGIDLAFVALEKLLTPWKGKGT